MANRVLRDHSQPCSHVGAFDSNDWEGGGPEPLWLCDRTLWCPGGREVTINREAAARQLAEALQRWGIRLSDETFQIDEWADSVVDAALGESDG